MRHRKSSLAAPLLLVLVLVLVAWASACSGGPDGPTTTPETALHHAQVCAQQLGRIPTWACQDGVQIPIHVGGVPVTTTPETCDDRDLKGECLVGSYVGAIAGENQDGSPRPEVSWVYFCRLNDNFAQMIGHDRTTGATCFFELNTGYLPLEDGVPKGKVPGIDDPDYEAAWKRPDQVAAGQCNLCHSPDPFIHTPYVDAARKPLDPSQPVLPFVASPTSPYFVVGDAFARWTFDYVDFEDNACTTCHRMPDFRRFTLGSGVDFNAHMPPLSPGSMKADFDAVMACLNQGPDAAPGCRWAALNGATPITDTGLTAIAGTGTFATTFGTLDVANPLSTGSGTLSAMGAGTSIEVTTVGAIAGALPAPSCDVQLDVIARQDLPGAPGSLHYIARFRVSAASFTSGKVFALPDATWSGELLIAGDDLTAAEPIGAMSKGTFTLTQAGTQPGDAVAGSFEVTWDKDSKK